MKIGYTRVSTGDQNPTLQLASLKRERCKRIFIDKASGASRKRPELEKCLKSLKVGDVLIVWKLGQLGRSLQDLIILLDDLKGQEVKFKSLTEAIDTETPTGRALPRPATVHPTEAAGVWGVTLTAITLAGAVGAYLTPLSSVQQRHLPLLGLSPEIDLRLAQHSLKSPLTMSEP